MSYRKIVWREEYSVGIETIDDQHKKLMDIVNIFLEAKADNSEAEVLKQTFTDIIEYTKYHFEAEEEEMQSAKYSALSKHKLLHKQLIQQIIEILEHLKEGRAYAVTELSMFLKNWLVNHILSEDKNFGDFLRKSGTSSSN